MSATSPALASALEKNVFARVKALDFAGAGRAARDYEREARQSMASRFSIGKTNNELHVDMLKVLQQIKNLDFAKLRLSDGSLTEMKELTAMLSQLTASLREEGTLVDSAHLEVHLLLILKSLDPIFHRNTEIVSGFHDFVRLRLRLRFKDGIDGVMDKLESYIEHIHSLSFNRGLSTMKSSPKEKSWVIISRHAILCAIYSRNHLDSVVERTYLRYSAFRNGPMVNVCPEVGQSLYTATIEELIALADHLPTAGDVDVSVATSRFKILQYLTALSLVLQLVGECRASGLAWDAAALRRMLTRLQSALATLDHGQSDLLADAFACAEWALNGAELRALPDVRHRESDEPLCREIQFYALQFVPQTLAQFSVESGDPAAAPTTKMTSLLSHSWNSCLFPFKPSNLRLLREVPKALEAHLKCQFILEKGRTTGKEIARRLAEIDAWQSLHGLAAEMAASACSYLDTFGVFVQKRANVDFVAGRFAQAVDLYRIARDLYLHRHPALADDAAAAAKPPSVVVQETRLWPCFEFLARAHEQLDQPEECVDSLVQGLREVRDENVFQRAFGKAVANCARLEKWTGSSLCEKLFKDDSSSSSPRGFPVDRFLMASTELNGWRSAKFNSIEHQLALLRFMRSSPGLSDGQEIWIAVEMVNVEHAASGVSRTDDEQNGFITELNKVVNNAKKIENPTANVKFALAKAYFLLHVITTSKLADSIQEKQKAQDAANKSPSTLPSAENPEGEENNVADLDSCTNFVTVSMQRRTFENLEKSFQLLEKGQFHTGGVVDSLSLKYEYLNLVSVMAAYWELGSNPERVLASFLLGVRFARANLLHDYAVWFAGKTALFLCRHEMYDVAGSVLRWTRRVLEESSSSSKAALDKCQHFQLARAWHAFGVGDHATSDRLAKDLVKNAKQLERNVLIELMMLRSAQLLTPSAAGPYVRGAENWETPQALLQFGMRLAESLSGQMGKNGSSSGGGGYKECGYVEMILLNLRVFSAFCTVCDSCEWVRESGFLYKEAFQIAERYGLAHWMAKIMLQRADRDLIMDEKNAAEARLREIKFILNSPGDVFLAHLKLTGVLSRKSLLHHDVSSNVAGSGIEDNDDDEDFFALPKVRQMSHHHNYHRSDEDSSPTRFAQKTASPIFKRTASSAPSFVTHAATCTCSFCEDLVYQICLFDLMVEHGALLLKQESPAQTVVAADAGLKIHAKMVDTWKTKRAAWKKAASLDDDDNDDDGESAFVIGGSGEREEDPFFDRLWKMKNLKAEASLALGKVGDCQAMLKPLVEEVESLDDESFPSSRWSKASTMTLGTSHYLYVVSLGSSLAASEKMMAADWRVLQTPIKAETPSVVNPAGGGDLPMDFEEMLNIGGGGTGFRKPSTPRRHDSENVPPKKPKKSENSTTKTPTLFPFSANSALKEAQINKPAFFIYSDNNDNDDDNDSAFLESKISKPEIVASAAKLSTSVGKAPKKRVAAKSRTARVNLQEPMAVGAAKKSATPKSASTTVKSASATKTTLKSTSTTLKSATPKSIKKPPPILSAETFVKAVVDSTTSTGDDTSITAFDLSSTTTMTTTPAETAASARSLARRKKKIPAIVFELPSSSEDNSPPEVKETVVKEVNGGVGKQRLKGSSRKAATAAVIPKMEAFVSSPEVSPVSSAPARKRAPARKKPAATTTTNLNADEAGAGQRTTSQKISPRRKLVESTLDAIASKRKCGGRRKPAESVVDAALSPGLDAVTKDMQGLDLSTPSKKDDVVHKSLSKSAKPRNATVIKAGQRKKGIPEEVARSNADNDDVDDDDQLNRTYDLARISSPSTSSSTTTTADESERDRFSADDNVFSPLPPPADVKPMAMPVQLPMPVHLPTHCNNAGDDDDVDGMDAEVIRKDSPNGNLRPKMKLFAGDVVDALAEEDTHDAQLGREEFTLKRATYLVKKAVDLMSGFPMGYIYRQCAERLALLSGSGDSVSCGGYAFQSAGLAFRHSCILNASKFVIRQKFRYQDSVPATCESVNNLLSFRMSPQDVVSRISEILPATWKLAQLSVVDATPNLPSTTSKPSSTSLLLVTLYSANSLLSNVLLPFNSRILDQYAAQLNANLDSIKKGHDDLVSYWEKRETEDKNMGRFLAATERDLLGPWVGLLMGDVAGDDQTVSSVSEGGFDWADLTTRAIEILPEVSQALDSSLLAILMQAFLKGFSKLTPALRCDGIQQLVGKSMPILEAHDSVKKIEKLLNQTVGRKGVKIKKILENLEPVIVVLDGHLQSLPVERFPSFEVNSSMTRVPSALFLPILIKHSAIHHQGGVDADKGWFLIDPASNLGGTKLRMEEWVKQAFPRWNGVVGQEPNTADALKQVRTQDIYLYCGHGSGAVFLGKDDVQRDLLRAVCLLVGCSGGLLTSLGGNLEPWGRVIPFIIGCAPAIVSPLWEVTDRDIDIYTQDMLDIWLKTKSAARVSLAKVMDKASEKLKCKYANGRAVVTYGLPVYKK